MKDYNCAICSENGGYIIANPIAHGELRLCQNHFNYLETIKNTILIELIKTANKAAN
jgi:hypothetical protein